MEWKFQIPYKKIAIAQNVGNFGKKTEKKCARNKAKEGRRHGTTRNEGEKTAHPMASIDY